MDTATVVEVTTTDGCPTNEHQQHRERLQRGPEHHVTPDQHNGAIEVAIDGGCHVLDTTATNGTEEKEEEEGEEEVPEEDEGRGDGGEDENGDSQNEQQSQCEETLDQNDSSHDVTLNGTTLNDVTRDVSAVGDGAKESVTSFDDSEFSHLLTSWNEHKAFCPVADMRGVHSLNYSKTEKHLRCKLAAAYRLADIYGWAPDGVSAKFTALTNRNEVLVAPQGLFHHELTASSFAKVSLEDGSVVDSGSTNLSFDLDELDLHSTIYGGREDIRCILHLTSPLTVSFSALKCGLFPLCSEAMEAGEVTYSEFTPPNQQQSQLGLNQNQHSKVMFLRNFGVVIGGETIEQAFHFANNIIEAIQVQLKILHLGLNSFHLPSEEKQKCVYESTTRASSDVVPSKLDRRQEDVAFEGQMRMLDSAGYQTGYLYRFPFISKRAFRSQSLVEVNPTTGLSSPISDHGSLRSGRNESVRSVTPNSSRHDKPLRASKSVIEKRLNNTQRFIPMGTDVREYKHKVKQIRKEFRSKGCSGPQSNALEGMTWQEARFQDFESPTATGVAKVTAASRGIIQREFQKTAVYKGYASVNPFGADRQTEIDDYMRTVEEKKRTNNHLSPAAAAAPANVLEVERIKLSTEQTKMTRIEAEVSLNLDKTHSTGKSQVSGKVEENLATVEAKIDRSDHVTETVVTSEVTKAEAEADNPSSISEERIRSFHRMNSDPPSPSGSASPKNPEDPPKKRDASGPATVEEAEAEVHHPVEQQQSTPASGDNTVSVSKSSKTKAKKSISVNDSSIRKQDSETVEMRSKEKEKKKKRGLSAIFSKKKDS